MLGLGFLTRMFRVLWRQESEGSRADTVGATVPAPQIHKPAAAHGRLPLNIELSPSEAVVLAFPASHAAPTGTKVTDICPSRHLAARLNSVQKLNQPAGRMRPRPATSPAGKPKPVAVKAACKPLRDVPPNAILNRMPKPANRAHAEIVDLSAVRMARLRTDLDLEIASVFG